MFFQKPIVGNCVSGRSHPTSQAPTEGGRVSGRREVRLGQPLQGPAAVRPGAAGKYTYVAMVTATWVLCSAVNKYSFIHAYHI